MKGGKNIMTNSKELKEQILKERLSN